MRKNRTDELQTPAGQAEDLRTQDEKDHAAGVGGSYMLVDGKPVLVERTDSATPISRKAEGVTKPTPAEAASQAAGDTPAV